MQLCMTIAQHAEKCYDFQIQHWLDEYMRFADEPINYSEAAFLISSVAQIYGRKVDFLEKLVLEFNQRGARDAAKMAARIAANNRTDVEKHGNDQTGDENNANAIDRAADQPNEVPFVKPIETPKPKSTRLKKKVMKTGRFEFVPKEFEMVDISEISLNLNPPPRNPEDEWGSPFRMKNHFPRINVLQQNMRKNNRFYESLELDEPDNEDADILRDFRLFMDTIDEPIPPIDGPDFKAIMAYDPTENNGKRKRASREDAQCIVYLPAAYLKEQYDIDLEDNSDYINMLRYNRELKRLKVAEMTIEEVMNCDFGTYLNDILHGTNESGQVAPLTEEETNELVEEAKLTNHYLSSTLPVYDPKTKTYDTRPWEECARKKRMANRSDDALLLLEEDSTVADTSADTTLNRTDATDANTSDDAHFDDSLETTIEPSADSTLLASADSSLAPNDDSTIVNTSVESADGSTLNVSQNPDESAVDANTTGETTANTLGDTSCLTTTTTTTEGELSIDQNTLMSTMEMNGMLSPMNVDGEAGQMAHTELIDSFSAMFKVIEPIPLTSNMLQIPEQLLRRPKIFKLTEEFEIWMAARKRKSMANLEPKGTKMFKMFDGTMVMVNNPNGYAQSTISDIEDFFGFDEFGNISALSLSDRARFESLRLSCDSSICGEFSGFDDRDLSTEQGEGDPSQPGAIVSRSFSNDSGIADKNAALTGIESSIPTDVQSLDQFEISSLDQASQGNSNLDDLSVCTKEACLTVADSGFSEIESIVQSELPELQRVDLLEDSELRIDTSLLGTPLPQVHSMGTTLPLPHTSLPGMQTFSGPTIDLDNTGDEPPAGMLSTNEQTHEL